MAATHPSLYEAFSISSQEDAREAAVVPIGELDLSCADELEREVRDLGAAGCRRIVLDLRQLRFIDSTGLRILLSLRNDAARDGHDLKLVPGPPEVQRLFHLTATTGLFDWRDY